MSPVTGEAGAEFWRQGKVWMSAVAVVTAIAGWMIYDAMMAPAWMRDFGLDIAARAKIVAVSGDATAFSTMKGRVEPDSPYVCFANLANFEWDRVYFVPSGGPVPDHVSALAWDEGAVAEVNDRMAGDERYQVIAFESNGVVVAHDYYFTMWADLTALARPDGFSKTEAVFVAESDGETYTVMPAGPSAASACV